MTPAKEKIFILEDDGYFRGLLEGAASEVGETTAVAGLEQAMGLLSQQEYRVLLLDWHLVRQAKASLFSTLDHYQSRAVQAALFTVPDLSAVVEAMKAGASEVLWPALERGALREKIAALAAYRAPAPIAHSFVSSLTETMTDKAVAQRTTLFQARKEFSKAFLRQVLSHQKLRRTQLADLMKVSPRTLHRHLSS